jgi:putative FmdB family regulatory protein
MPIYEYKCNHCGHALEAMQKFSDAVLTDCPACGRPALKKQLSAAGFQLKGSGWYATDSKGKGKTKEPDSEAKPGSKKTGGCGGGTCGCAH